MSAYTEDTLVQQTTAEYVEHELGWESVYAYNNEDFGPDSLLGRASDREVVLPRYLRAKIAELNGMNSELNGQLREARETIARLQGKISEVRFWLGAKGDHLFIDGEGAQYQTEVRDA